MAENRLRTPEPIDGSWADLPAAVPERARGRLAGSWKVLLLLAALGSLLIPPGQASTLSYPLLFGVPLIAAAVWQRRDTGFLLWSAYALVFVAFVLLRRYADDTSVPTSVGYAIDADRVLFGGTVPTLWLQSRLYAPGGAGWLEYACMGVHMSYYFAPPATALALWLLRREVFVRFVLALIGTYALGLLLHFTLPTAPPWLAAADGALPPVHRIMQEALAGGVFDYGNAVAGGNDVAAMPSLHMAAAWLVALGAWRVRPATGMIASLYPAAMLFALVYLGEHYVIDALAGMAVSSLCWLLVPRWLTRLPRSAAAE
ncbi:phosphatase PAP2 family protein [soil metagenome]